MTITGTSAGHVAVCGICGKRDVSTTRRVVEQRMGEHEAGCGK